MMRPVMSALMSTDVLASIVPLGLVMFYVVQRGSAIFGIDFLTNDKFRQLLKENNIKLITWREVGKLIEKQQ